MHLESIGGARIHLPSNENLNLPSHIPILPDRLKTPPSIQSLPFIAVHGGNMFSSNGEKINKNYLNKGFQHALNLDPKTKGILQFYVKDRSLEGFWDNRHSIYPNLEKMNFHAVIAPNFSVYEDAPRIDHLYNMKRSSVVYRELLDHGINAIPDISWYNRRDLDKWCREIHLSKVKTISFSFQVVDIALKASTIWKSCLLGFRYLCENIPSDTSIIIAGLVSSSKAGEVFKAAKGQSLHILNQSAFVQSRRGTVSETREQNITIPYDDLFIQNIKYFNKIYKNLSYNSIKNGGDIHA